MDFSTELETRIFKSGPVLYRKYRVTANGMDLTDEYSVAIVRGMSVSSVGLDTRRFLGEWRDRDLVLWLSPDVVLEQESDEFKRPPFLWEICIPPDIQVEISCGRSSTPKASVEVGELRRWVKPGHPNVLLVCSGSDGAVVRLNWSNWEIASAALVSRNVPKEILDRSHQTEPRALAQMIDDVLGTSAPDSSGTS